MSTVYQLHHSKPIRLRPFAVTIRTGDRPEALNILAASSCDAIVKAMELFFDDDGVVPNGLYVCSRPIHRVEAQ